MKDQGPAALIARLVSVPFFLIVGGYGLMIGLVEARAWAQIDRPMAQILAEASGGTFALLPARSHRFRRAQMDLCLRSANDPSALVFPPAAIAALASACEARSAAILADAPTHAAALAVAAMSQGSQLLDRSWAFAPFEGWLAAQRFSLGYNRFPSADGTVAYQGIVDDAALLVSLGQMDEVALAYVEAAGFRTAFGLKLPNLPASDQRRFFAAVEALGIGVDDGL